MAYDTSLKNGVLGGQTIYGGTAAGDDLIIDSTTNATKGGIVLNPTGGEVGIGVNPPTNTLHVVDTVASTGVQNAVLLDITGAGSDANRKVAERINLNPGYTGTGISACILAKNDSIQSEQSYVTVSNIVEAAKGNFGIIGDANHSNANGSGIGVLGFSTGSAGAPKFNTGVMGAAYSGVGVYGIGGYAGNRIGGFFESYNPNSRTDMTVFGNAALVACNGTSNTDDVARFYNNTTKVGAIDKTGRVEPISTTTQLRLSYTEGAVYSDFTTNSSGNLTISPTGGYVFTTRFGFDTSTYFIADGAAPGARLYLDGAKYIKFVNLAGIATVFSANDNFIQITSGNAVLEGASDSIISTSANTKVSLAPNRTVVLYAQNGHIYIPTDSSKLYWGGGNDQSIYYDGTSGYIKTNEVAASDLHLTTGAAKTLVLDTVVYEDLNFDPSSSGGPPATLPDYVTINNVTYREFTSANNQTCGSGEEFPHEFFLGGTCYPHIHIFLKGGESAGTTGVTFTFYWSYRESTGVTTNSVTLSATSAELTAEPDKWTINDPTGFVGPTELGGQLSIRIARTGGDAGDVVVMTYGVHYPIDTMGSRQVTAK